MANKLKWKRSGAKWRGYSGNIEIAVVGPSSRFPNRWYKLVKGVDGLEVATADSYFKSVAEAKVACNEVWDKWLTAAGLRNDN